MIGSLSQMAIPDRTGSRSRRKAGSTKLAGRDSIMYDFEKVEAGVCRNKDVEPHLELPPS